MKSADTSLFHSFQASSKGNEEPITSGVVTVHFLGQANLHITACDAAISDRCCTGNSPALLGTGITPVSDLRACLGSCSEFVEFVETGARRTLLGLQRTVDRIFSGNRDPTVPISVN